MFLFGWHLSAGMFIYNEEYRTFWFNRNSMESEQEFNLVSLSPP
jgi:hypothetical protein